MDYSSREASTSSSSIMSGNITGNLEEPDTGKISPQTGATSDFCASAPVRINMTREEVTCMVKNKERLLGYVFAGPTGAYSEYVCAGNISYKPGDSVYLEKPNATRRDNFELFNIVRIYNFFRNELDNCLHVRVQGYKRLTEIPPAWFAYFQDRDNVNNSGAEIIAKSNHAVSRELVFNADLFETYPVSALRGVTQVCNYRDFHTARDFKPRPNRFYYIFWKSCRGNAKDKELASAQGSAIRVGGVYQARLPAFEEHVTPEYLARAGPEEALWRPQGCEDDDEFHMYENSVRSMFAYRNMQTSDPDHVEFCAYMREEEVQTTMDTLHKCKYDCQEALEKLLMNMKMPSSQTGQKKFREEEIQRFIKGYKKFGKNFFKIQRDFLPLRTTAQLTEYYYLHKHISPSLKTLRRPAAGRRQTGAVVRRMRGRPNRTLSADYVDLSPSSDEERESDDSDKDLTNLQCSNCSTTESKEWHPTTKDSQNVLCSDCRLFYKKYGEIRPTDERENSFTFKPIGDEENNENVAVVAKNGPTTRRAVGRPKSALAVNSPEAAEKSRSSPGTVSVSSSSSGDQKKKTTRGKGAKTAKAAPAPVAPVAEPTVAPDAAPPTPNSRKRRKTSASETNSESSFTECQTDEAAAATRAVERAVGATPPVPSPTAEIQANFSSLDVQPHVHQPSATCLSPKTPVKREPATLSPVPTASPAAGRTDVKSEPTAEPVMTKVKVEESAGRSVKSEDAAGQSDSPKPSVTRKRDKENFKLELSDIQVDREESRTPAEGRKVPGDRTPDQEPKPDRVLIECQTWKTATFHRMWNRGESNSCARTDLAYCPKPESILAKKRASAPSMPSPAKTTNKSPAPPSKDKDGKRTPMVSQQSGGDRDRERDRDNRSVTTAQSGPRIADTPPRDRSLPQRQSSLTGLPGPHMPDPMLHGPGGPYGGMPPFLHLQREQQLREMEQRERSLQFARAGSVPPGMMTGMPGLNPHEVMELQRRMQQHPGMMGGMYPGGLNPQQMAASYAAAVAEQQQQQQHHMMLASLMGASQHSPASLAAHLHANPELQHDPSFQFLMAGGGVPGGFGGAFPGPQLTPDMIHMMTGGGRPNSFEHHQFLAHQQAQAVALQQHHQRAEADQQLRMMQQMSQLPHFGHPDMMR